MKKIFNTILNFFFPQKCIGCGLKNIILCQKCTEKIDYPTLLEANNIFSATDYNDELAKKAIWLLKYHKVKTITEPLAELIYQRLWPKINSLGSSTAKWQEWLIIPIPLSKKRLRERRFNQTELIAKHLSDKINQASVMLKTNVLYKKIHTDTQVSIKDREKRLNNLKGSFEIKNPELIKNKNIILIDDVTTTGATITEARKTLKNANAKKVIAFVVARG